MTKQQLSTLSEEARSWLKQIERRYTFEPQHEPLLLTCGRCLDRITEARQAVSTEGAYFTDKHGVVRSHPGIKIERDSQHLLSRTLQLLDILNDETPKLPPQSRRPRRGVK
ncbi:MAG: hypothetical protein HOP18_14780 [Deltaproteobacteria bacterium]|nr:hypothetical protein [Deltaproteobacteria bacterium]